MERKSMIKVRGGFSDRAGIDPCNIQMQIDDFDEKLGHLLVINSTIFCK